MKLHLVLRCFKKIMNTKIGIKKIIQTKDALGIIFLGFNSPDSTDQQLVVEFLTLICYVDQPKGQAIVLEVIN